MLRATFILLLGLSLYGATVRLYLKDGSFHNVREYKTSGDRVRYYSTERGDWEEIPLELVDLKRTENERSERETERQEVAKAIDEEEKAERAQVREVELIPMQAGVFRMSGETMTPLKQAESKVVTSKGRSILKAIAPIPIISGKANVEIDGVNSATILNADRPDLYMRLSAEERFALVKLQPAKNSRIVQKWNIVPVSNEVVEETEIIETFKQQLGEGLYKIWPTKPLVPGEYAVVQYTEGKGNIQVWDFAIPAAVKAR